MHGEAYQGVEQGPIRPPSEAGSLLLRVSRNCPWNRCTFCGIYQGETFSIRPKEHVLADIDTIGQLIRRLEDLRGPGGILPASRLAGLAATLDEAGRVACHAALHWLRHGCRSVFLQDSNSLIVRPDDLEEILRHLRQVFPGIRRITSYARSRTIARLGEQDLARLAAAGLNRLHVGMESGSDAVLARVRKGADKETHIQAGRRVKAAGLELSLYVMPGLGGLELSGEHARESADALNQIDPDFIRLRTLALPDHIELAKASARGEFTRLGDRAIAEEILQFLEALEGIGSTVKSDHILNLLEEVEGVLPMDRERMIGVIRRFLDLSPSEQLLFQVGRRTGLLRRLADLEEPGLRDAAQEACRDLGVTEANLDLVMEQLVRRFV